MGTTDSAVAGDWKMASCDVDLRDMVVGKTYSCTITTSDGRSYTTAATFRESWTRYWPVGEAQGSDCDLSGRTGALFDDDAVGSAPIRERFTGKVDPKKRVYDQHHPL